MANFCENRKNHGKDAASIMGVKTIIKLNIWHWWSSLYAVQGFHL